MELLPLDRERARDIIGHKRRQTWHMAGLLLGEAALTIPGFVLGGPAWAIMLLGVFGLFPALAWFESRVVILDKQAKLRLYTSPPTIGGVPLPTPDDPEWQFDEKWNGWIYRDLLLVRWGNLRRLTKGRRGHPNHYDTSEDIDEVNDLYAPEVRQCQERLRDIARHEALGKQLMGLLLEGVDRG